MEEGPPVPARLVRKSAYGRTQLFLPSASVALREIKCMGGVTKRETAHVYHLLPDAREADGACCWHCCEPIATGEPVVPLPRVYTDGVFHVYGRTCSPGCAKAYVLEHTTFDRGQHLNVLVKMLREVYGVQGHVFETPPRPALRRFGGAFDPRNQPRAECRLVEPPFVSYCMLVEERAAPEGIPQEADALDEPPPPGLFADYVRERRDGSTPAGISPAGISPAGMSPAPATSVPATTSATTSVPAPNGASSAKKRRTASDSRVAGPLARFAKPPSTKSEERKA